MFEIIFKKLIENTKGFTVHEAVKTLFFPMDLFYFFLIILFVIILFIYFSKVHTNLIIILIYLELGMLLLGILFGSLYLIDVRFNICLVYSITLLALSAAESVVGLCLILLYFKSTKGSIDISKQFTVSTITNNTVDKNFILKKIYQKNDNKTQKNTTACIKKKSKIH